jgi:hypothetical protein
MFRAVCFALCFAGLLALLISPLSAACPCCAGGCCQQAAPVDAPGPGPHYGPNPWHGGWGYPTPYPNYYPTPVPYVVPTPAPAQTQVINGVLCAWNGTAWVPVQQVVAAPGVCDPVKVGAFHLPIADSEHFQRWWNRMATRNEPANRRHNDGTARSVADRQRQCGMGCRS